MIKVLGLAKVEEAVTTIAAADEISVAGFSVKMVCKRQGDGVIGYKEETTEVLNEGLLALAKETSHAILVLNRIEDEKKEIVQHVSVAENIVVRYVST